MASETGGVRSRSHEYIPGLSYLLSLIVYTNLDLDQLNTVINKLLRYMIYKDANLAQFIILQILVRLHDIWLKVDFL